MLIAKITRCDEHIGTCNIVADGSVFEIVSDISRVIRTLYRDIGKEDPSVAAAFREAIANATADPAFWERPLNERPGGISLTSLSRE